MTAAELDELAKLNEAVEDAIIARRDWLDAKMAETSRLQVGDDIYDLDSGQKLGKVTGLYRYWRDRDEGVRDHSVSCDYTFETGRLMSDNTSRYGWSRRFGTREDALQRAEERAARLR